MNKNIHLSNENDMQLFASRLASAIVGGAIVFLIGELGAGKTTLTRYVLRAYDVIGKVKSPTFTIVEPYTLENGTRFIHFDFYRIQDSRELIHLGLEDYFTDTAICLIEWPQHAAGYLPTADVTIQFIASDMMRDLVITTSTARGEKIIQSL